MITRKALQQILDAAQKAEDDGPCWCTDEDCELGHEDPALYPSHVVSFVTSDGRLDKASNEQYLCWSWGVDGAFEDVTEYPQNWPDFAERMVVVERATGQWYPATAYL